MNATVPSALDHLDLFGTLMNAAAELRSAAEVTYASRYAAGKPDDEMLAAARAASARAVAAIDEWRKG